MEIWLFIAGENLEVADRFLSELEAKTQMLLRHPEMGRQREELLTSMRSIPIGRYIVFYRVAEKISRLFGYFTDREISTAFSLAARPCRVRPAMAEQQDDNFDQPDRQVKSKYGINSFSRPTP